MYVILVVFFCFNDTATTEIYTYGHTLSLPDALPIFPGVEQVAEQHRIFATGEGVAVVEAQAVRRQAPEVDQHVGGVRVVDLGTVGEATGFEEASGDQPVRGAVGEDRLHRAESGGGGAALRRSEEHTSELQSLMGSSYAVFSSNKTN